MSDVNDNAPKFELPDYQAHNVDEDIPLGTNILKVKATDADSGANAEIEYLVSDDHFSVDSNGIIVNNKQLDADNNNAYYEFIVTAKDKGKNKRRYVTNTRDINAIKKYISLHKSHWQINFHSRLIESNILYNFNLLKNKNTKLKQRSVVYIFIKINLLNFFF